MTSLTDLVTTALADSPYATATVQNHGRTWDGMDLVTAEWAWEDAARAEFTAFLAAALPGCKVRDHVTHTRIYRAN